MLGNGSLAAARIQLRNASIAGSRQAIIADDKLIVVGPQFGGRERTNQTARCDVRFNQVQRSQSDAQAIDGSLKLKVDVIQLKVSDRCQA